MHEISHLKPMPGGYSGRVFMSQVPGDPSIVRIYPPEMGRRNEIEAAILTLVNGLVPVAEVLDVRRGDSAQPGLLIESMLPGCSLADLELGESDQRVVGSAIAKILIRLAGVPFWVAGPFVDAQLAVGSWPVEFPEWYQVNRVQLGDVVAGGGALAELVDSAVELLSETPRACLVHADFNPKNILVGAGSARASGPQVTGPQVTGPQITGPQITGPQITGPQITGIVDWEFAYAGHPFTDLGNFLRSEARPALVHAVTSEFAEFYGVEPDTAQRYGVAADLWAVMELCLRPSLSPPVALARARLASIASVGLDATANPKLG
jgi:aminoglycoside phosphotransferase (APT) family kinase protein